jgi:murein DD-endopeptidase MepM/ murein hydrolase activator NlpD
MVNPVPGRKITTSYGKRGRYWSCFRNSSGGIHTGADYAAPSGTKVVAARSGTVRWTSYGSAFGSRQFAIRCADGTEDFYAHTRTRPANGKKVKAGEKVAEVGSLGNSTGPHLHFERHKKQGSWNCSVMTNPQPSIDKKATVTATKTVRISKLKYGTRNSTAVKKLQRALNAKAASRGGKKIKVTGNYLIATDREVRLCQRKHGYGNDPVKKSSVGMKQAKYLFKGRGITPIA